MLRGCYLTFFLLAVAACSNDVAATVELATADSYLRFDQSEAPLRNTEPWSAIVWIYFTAEPDGLYSLIDQPGVFSLTGSTVNEGLTATFFDADGADHIVVPIAFVRERERERERENTTA